MGTIGFDEDNIDDVTSDGVTLVEIEAVFLGRPTVRRNRPAIRLRQGRPSLVRKRGPSALPTGT